MWTEQLTQALAILARMAPNTIETGNTFALELIPIPSDIRRILWILSLGAFTGSPAIDFKLQGSNDGGSTWTDIPNAAIVTTTNQGTIVTIETRDDQLQNYNAIMAVVSNNGEGESSTTCTIFAIGDTAAYKPANILNIADVSQQIVL